MDDKIGPRIALVVWAAVAGFGAVSAAGFFHLGEGPLAARAGWIGALGLFFMLVDRIEGEANFRMAQRETGPWFGAVRSACFWLRGLGVLSFVLGAVALAFLAFGWRPGPGGGWADLGAHLLFLQVLLGYFGLAYVWVSEPMRKAHLGSIVALQRRGTKAGIDRQMAAWQRMLARGWLPDPVSDEEAGRALGSAVRTALWRDIVGFIPVYGAALAFGLWWIGAELGCPFLGRTWHGLPVWAWWPLGLAAANGLADVAHLAAVAGRLPAWLAPVAWLLTVAKFMLFGIGYAGLAAAWAAAAWRLGASGGGHGLAGWAALAVSVLAALAVIAIGVGAAIYRPVKRRMARPRGVRLASFASGPER